MQPAPKADHFRNGSMLSKQSSCTVGLNFTIRWHTNQILMDVPDLRARKLESKRLAACGMRF